MLYAVELFSVRDELKKDLWGTLRKVKKMGYDGVEFFWEFSHTAQELAAALDDTGLICTSWHTPWHYVQPSNLLGTITYNKVLGNNEIVIPYIDPEKFATKDACLKTAAELEEVAEKLADYGMNLSYHNHGHEFKNIEGNLPWNYLYENTTRLKMQLDNGNAWIAGPETDIYDPITRFPERANTLHIKPFSLEKGHATMIGEDDIDWPRFFNLCETHQNIEWYIVEYECEEIYTQLKGIEKCLQALKKMEREGKI